MPDSPAVWGLPEAHLHTARGGVVTAAILAGGTAFALFPIVLGAVPAMIVLAGALAIGVIVSAIAW